MDQLTKFPHKIYKQNIVKVQFHFEPKKLKERKHLSTTNLYGLVTLSGTMIQVETLEHLSNCSFCNKRYIKILEKDLLQLPMNFSEKVFLRLEENEKNRRIMELKKKKNDYYKYCGKVVIACAASLLLLVGINKLYQQPYNGESSKEHKFILEESLDRLKILGINGRNRYEIKKK